ncbi:YjgF-like protein [Dichomitus squalens]|uniref:YjgF-like protein n=1 Tax=Dichomitus squalens TaxID=114155 RepID=A0A4V2K738_9APHY|nr:YjgF-like protein [Dichomitus squalens LYAD-421 SS1]EJF63179.1 YjgF-like protein [Dichomitus squalens LYAD-421 SS1]TBU31830.1 YjgF-like protein [Dichomitus squalens]TBU44487.1 YjgF-like protein [Dichomitus squalens]TBU54618.1 YjgF-like protein [Dichomitus squalens]
MTKQVVFTEEANPPLPIYSQAIISGKTIYVSGSIGIDREFKLVEGGVQAQTRAALDNLTKVLKGAGVTRDSVLKVNIFLTNLQRDFAPLNEVYQEYFPTNPPARTCIGVAALPLGADVEIECIAELP